MPFRENAVLYGQSKGPSISALATNGIAITSKNGAVDLSGNTILDLKGGGISLSLDANGLHLPAVVDVNAVPLYDTPYGYVSAINVNSEETLPASAGANLLYPTIVYTDNAVPGFNVATGTYTIPIAGRYLVVAQARLVPAPTIAEIDFYIYLNPVTQGIVVGMQSMTTSTTDYTSAIVSAIVQCAIGDILQIEAVNGGTTAQYIQGGRGYNSLQINRVL